MKTASPLMRWKEIVHPLFWPVFFWNLRWFAVYMRNLVEETGGNGLIHYEVTWWGGIRVYRHFNPDGAKWDDGLGTCGQRVHLATLDILNPCLSAVPAIFALFRPSELVSNLPKWPATGDAWAGLNSGSFPEPAHLNTS